MPQHTKIHSENPCVNLDLLDDGTQIVIGTNHGVAAIISRQEHPHVYETLHGLHEANEFDQVPSAK